MNTFVVNIRHFLMTASLNEKMKPEKRWIKAIYSFGITDETFSVLATSKKGKISTAFAFGVALIAYGSWVIFTAIGHVVGANLPLFLQAAMSIALYAMFIGLLVPSMKGNRKVVMLAGLAAAIHCFLYFTGFFNGLGNSRCNTRFFNFLKSFMQDAEKQLKRLYPGGGIIMGPTYWWMLFGMALVTYIPRMIPLTFLGW